MSGQVQKLEMLISVLILVMAACFFGEMNYVKPPAAAVVKGLFVPRLSGQGAIGSAIALWGSIIVPYMIYCFIKYPCLLFLFFSFSFFGKIAYCFITISFLLSNCLCYSISIFLINRHNLFLYSALVLSRKVPRSVSAINVRIYIYI